jgi:tetratricopeptide (TPR) repeat protein
MTATRSKCSAHAGESALARGLAYYSGGSPAQALPALEGAVAAAGLRPQLQALALKVHGNALMEAVWEVHETADLDDFKRWSALDPENHEARLAIGLVLRDLGAYDEAILIFGNLIPAWPE